MPQRRGSPKCCCTETTPPPCEAVLVMNPRTHVIGEDGVVVLGSIGDIALHKSDLRAWSPAAYADGTRDPDTGEYSLASHSVPGSVWARLPDNSPDINHDPEGTSFSCTIFFLGQVLEDTAGVPVLKRCMYATFSSGSVTLGWWDGEFHPIKSDTVDASPTKWYGVQIEQIDAANHPNAYRFCVMSDDQWQWSYDKYWGVCTSNSGAPYGGQAYGLFGLQTNSAVSGVAIKAGAAESGGFSVPACGCGAPEYTGCSNSDETHTEDIITDCGIAVSWCYRGYKLTVTGVSYNSLKTLDQCEDGSQFDTFCAESVRTWIDHRYMLLNGSYTNLVDQSAGDLYDGCGRLISSGSDPHGGISNIYPNPGATYAQRSGGLDFTNGSVCYNNCTDGDDIVGGEIEDCTCVNELPALDLIIDCDTNFGPGVTIDPSGSSAEVGLSYNEDGEHIPGSPGGLSAGFGARGLWDHLFVSVDSPSVTVSWTWRNYTAPGESDEITLMTMTLEAFFQKFDSDGNVIGQVGSF